MSSPPLPLCGNQLKAHLHKNGHDTRLISTLVSKYASFQNKPAARDATIKAAKKSDFWKMRGYAALPEREQQSLAAQMWRDVPLIFDKRCARCRMVTKSEHMLGGNYGGVVCTSHKVCEKCWWDHDGEYGARTFEAKSKVPLVEGPRKGASPVCYGCLYRVPFSVYRIDICLPAHYAHYKPTQQAYDDNVIELD